jgi:hypothetical protein
VIDGFEITRLEAIFLPFGILSTCGAPRKNWNGGARVAKDEATAGAPSRHVILLRAWDVNAMAGTVALDIRFRTPA